MRLSWWEGEGNEETNLLKEMKRSLATANGVRGIGISIEFKDKKL